MATAAVLATNRESSSSTEGRESAVTMERNDADINFQRVSISGEDTSGVPLEDLERASTLLIEALRLRSHYMAMSDQSFPSTTARFLKTVKLKDRINNLPVKEVSGEFLYSINPIPYSHKEECKAIFWSSLVQWYLQLMHGLGWFCGPNLNATLVYLIRYIS